MNENYTATRGDIEDDILEQVGNEIQEAILLHAPESWSQEKRDAIEESVLAETQMILDALSTTELQSDAALQRHIGRVIAETRRLIHQGGVSVIS
jgi:hypothetical protein